MEFVVVTKPQGRMLEVVKKYPGRDATFLGRQLWGGEHPSKGASYIRSAYNVLRNLAKKKLVVSHMSDRSMWAQRLWYPAKETK